MNNNKEKFHSRKLAFQFLYQTQLDGTDISSKNLKQHFDDFEKSYAELDLENPDNQVSPVIKKKGLELITGLLSKESELEELISKNLHNWKISNLSKVDITILKIGCYELAFSDNAPPKVVINETINLAKMFGKKESYSIVNGVLDSVWKSL